jgi:hypothetical protein
MKSTKTTKIKLTNNFHNASMNIVLDSKIVEYCLETGSDLWLEISFHAEDDHNLRARFNRINRTLCGVSGCGCSPVSSWEVVS